MGGVIRAARLALSIAAVVGSGVVLIRRLRQLEREIERW
jgi:hypothetical protein